MRYELSPKNTVIVRGPASITLVGGQATILGAPFAPPQTKIIGRHKQSPIETESDAELEISFGETGEMFEVQGSTIPTSWRLASEALEQMVEGEVVIVGPPDVGKSTLCTYLVNKLLRTGRNLCVIDADIGQTDMGPPTTIARAVPTHPITSLQELMPDRRLFIGHISPSSVEQKLISCIRRLSANREKLLTIINTDGWVMDIDAVLYKIKLLTQIQPDLVLGLATSNQLEPILDGIRFHSMKLAAAKNILERSRVDRRTIRSEAYRRFLEGGAIRRISLENIQLSFPPGFPGVSRVDRRALSNLILGILDYEGYLAQIGILIDIEDDVATIYTKHSGAPRNIEVGYVKISTSDNEIGFL